MRDPFHIHGGDGSIEGMESNESGRFRDLPMDGKFVLPEAISPDVFVDFKSLDLRLKDSFQPMDGYKPIPFEKIGLVKDDFRTNLPDKKEYREQVYLKYKDDIGGRYDAEKVNARYPLPAYLK